jgi:hypothetical protein
MARPRDVRVMISSRANSHVFDGSQTLSALRLDLAQSVEKEPLLGAPLFQVWIHESATAAPGTRDAWEESMDEVRRADVMIVLYNGEAGWAVEEGEVGICHEEMREALDTAPGKVYLIALDPLAPLPRASAAAGQRDRRFRAYVEARKPFHGQAARDAGELKATLFATLRAAVAELVGLGVREAGRGRYHSGEALVWSRLDFGHRKLEMEKVARQAILGRHGARKAGQSHVALDLGGFPVLFECHAIPAAMGVAAAREMVGQPFLRDHETAPLLEKEDVDGPVHLVLCHHGITETQGMKMLGFPDATVVAAPFGLYVADDVQKIQLVFVAGCRDETATRHGVQRFFDWLGGTGEAARLARRAAARRRIVAAIAQERAVS